jgi:hypothetical protein
MQSSIIRLLPLKTPSVTQPFFLYINTSRIKYDTTITNRYSSVISENNVCVGHKYKLSIDYKGTMEREKDMHRTSRSFLHYIKGEVLPQT